MKPIEFQDDAQIEFDLAITHYKNERWELGKEFQDEVEAASPKIQENPQRGTRFHRTRYRSVLVHRFPYVIFYEELDDHIRILAVAHASRRPGYWTPRTFD